jgi:hypothetical protein
MFSFYFFFLFQPKNVSSTSVMATDESHSKVEFKKVFLFFRFSDSDNKKVNFWIQKSLFKQFQQVSRYTNTKKLFYSKKEKMDFFFTRKTKGRVLCSAGYLLSNYCCLDIDQWNVPIPFYVSLYFLVKNLYVRFSFSLFYLTVSVSAVISTIKSCLQKIEWLSIFCQECITVVTDSISYFLEYLS